MNWLALLAFVSGWWAKKALTKWALNHVPPEYGLELLQHELRHPTRPRL